MNDSDPIEQFSQHRLRGASLPPDLAILFANRAALQDRAGMAISGDPDWHPWDDISYLTEKELARPDITANVKAMDDVIECISFVAATEHHEYLGYWRGPAARAVDRAPVVWLDNEGQFHLCVGRNLADAIVMYDAVDDDDFADWKAWMDSLGIAIPYACVDEMPEPESDPTPDALYGQLFDEYLARIRSTQPKPWWRFW